ncbi:MAG TPA: hypothetical protein VHL78_12470, partial [Actinomycetota bacterium]|nr:hypothetical protein [Actinomycetota bacterium]
VGVARADAEARVAQLRREIEDLALRFSDAAAPALSDALRRSLERLVVARAEWFNGLDEASASALRRSAEAAIDRGAQRVAGRLRDLDLWLNPTVSLPHPPAPNLDQPNHRAWIALLNAADYVDPVLLEYGLAPSELPDRGGAHYGLQPQRLRELDPRGTLDRLWRRYVGVYERYREALRRIPEDQQRDERERALRRWRHTE